MSAAPFLLIHAVELAAKERGVKLPDLSRSDLLANLPYEQELALKQAALAIFIRENHLDLHPAAITPSPRARHYRTTSKRRVMVSRGGQFSLALGYGRDPRHPSEGEGALLEAELHGEIYQEAEKLLANPRSRLAAEALNYLVLRGSYTECALIFNVCRINAGIVRQLKAVAEKLHAAIPALTAAFVMVDESCSGYYLEMSAGPLKKLYGSAMLVRKLGDKKLFYPPDAFFQVNDAMVETFASTAVAMLDPAADDLVLDLYCGCGLLTVAAAEKADHLIGIEWDGGAVRAAQAGAPHWFPQKDLKFWAGEIGPGYLRKYLPPAGRRCERIILDPPRAGAAGGVIEALAARQPQRVVHIFCGTDEIPSSLKRWQKGGYLPTACQVLDMFPGSANLETMIALEKSKDRSPARKSGQGCRLCPRHCGVVRSVHSGVGSTVGFCRVGTLPRVARAALHQWEEPCISGTRGSGTVFFCGCNLGCIFCQNRDISRGENLGVELTAEELRKTYFNLIRQGAHNINLVTPTPFVEAILASLAEPIPVPVVYNTNGYDDVSTLRRLEGKIQIYLPDLKYADALPALAYSAARDYFTVAKQAIDEMYRQTGPFEFDGDGMLKKGVVIRHLIMPGRIGNTKRVIDYVATRFRPGEVLFSLMRQYTPCSSFPKHPELERRITEEEYEEAENYLFDAGIEDGFVQEADSAQSVYIPAFDGTGVKPQP